MEDEVSLIETGEKGSKNATDEAKEVLYRRVEELKHLNAVLLEENDMYEQFISRLDAHELMYTNAVEDPGLAGAKGGDRGWRQESQSGDHFQQLPLQQKLYVAQSEIFESQQEQERLKHKYERIQDGYWGSLKEAELRLEDIRRAKSEFERRLIKPLKDKRLEINQPERVLQYIKDKSKVNQLEKYSLKNQAMRANEKKLLQQLQQRKEMGKAEYEEIFQEFTEQRTELNLDEVRVNSLKAQHSLSLHKEKLQTVTCELSNLSKEIKKKEQTLGKIEAAIQHAEEERVKAQILNQHLNRQIADYVAPDTTEYMVVKEKYRKLQQNILTWERKVGVAELGMKTYSKARTKHRATFTPVNSAETRARSGGHQFSVKLPDIAEHKEKDHQFQ